MLITRTWLHLHIACKPAVQLFVAQSEDDAVKILETLVNGNEQLRWASIGERLRLEWAYWLLSYALDVKNRVRFAINAVRQVLPLFADRFPNDTLLHEAVDIAEQLVVRYQRHLAKKSELAAREAFRIGSALNVGRADITGLPGIHGVPYAVGHVADAVCMLYDPYFKGNYIRQEVYSALGHIFDMDEPVDRVSIINCGIELIREQDESESVDGKAVK